MIIYQEFFQDAVKKTMLKLYNDKNLLQQKFLKEEGSEERYKLNRQLVDFKYIPQQFQDKFQMNQLF